MLYVFAFHKVLSIKPTSTCDVVLPHFVEHSLVRLSLLRGHVPDIGRRGGGGSEAPGEGGGQRVAGLHPLDQLQGQGELLQTQHIVMAHVRQVPGSQKQPVIVF